jgi:hypothetical protein
MIIIETKAVQAPTAFVSVPIESIEMSTISPTRKVKSVLGTIPVPVMRKTPWGKEVSRSR